MDTKNKLPKFAFVKGYGDGDCWEGLYIDGKLVMENHSLDTGHVMEELKKHGIDVRYIFFENDDYFEKSGYRHFDELEKVLPYDENKREG